VPSVTPLEQVLGSCLEALGAEQFKAEGVGEPVGRVERRADRLMSANSNLVPGL
jgi:hypothetical protein